MPKYESSKKMDPFKLYEAADNIIKRVNYLGNVIYEISLMSSNDYLIYEISSGIESHDNFIIDDMNNILHIDSIKVHHDIYDEQYKLILEGKDCV